VVIAQCFDVHLLLLVLVLANVQHELPARYFESGSSRFGPHLRRLRRRLLLWKRDELLIFRLGKVPVAAVVGKWVTLGTVPPLDLVVTLRGVRVLVLPAWGFGSFEGCFDLLIPCPDATRWSALL
jgi:hypothetical protein